MRPDPLTRLRPQHHLVPGHHHNSDTTRQEEVTPLIQHLSSSGSPPSNTDCIVNPEQQQHGASVDTNAVHAAWQIVTRSRARAQPTAANQLKSPIHYSISRNGRRSDVATVSPYWTRMAISKRCSRRVAKAWTPITISPPSWRARARRTQCPICQTRTVLVLLSQVLIMPTLQHLRLV